jgi:A/G-specific adenine glycosylase
MAKRANRADAVLAWAADHGRDLPWRHTRDPWAILVSEAMAQQTQVDRVVPKWHLFLENWPTPASCAAASLGEVLRLWQGLGYPRRAKNLHACAALITKQGAFPDTLDELLLLPGVGPYTARAVMAFAFGVDVAVVDTNTARVLARWGNRQLNRSEVQRAADEALPPGEGWAWNQALLDFGAKICTLRSPSCQICPVSAKCAYKGIGVDPAIGTSGVSVKQATFAGSDRQIRGKLLRMAASSLRRGDAVQALALDNQSDRVMALIDGLQSEGLLAETNGLLHLPD